MISNAPDQILPGLTFAPDPVAALKAWTAATWPGQVRTEEVGWQPEQATPAVFWRIPRMPEMSRTVWGTWMLGEIHGYVLQPSPQMRAVWVRHVLEALAVTSRLTLSDGSLVRLSAVAADLDADPLRVGQVRVTARWAVKKAADTSEPLETLIGTGDLPQTVDISP